jgi:transglutaminase/protease-like cytokinesis protein 3
LEKFDDSITIKLNNYNANTYSLSVINNILDDHYDIDYGVQGAGGTIYSDGNIYVVNITLKYKLPKNQMIHMRDKAKAKATQIISRIIKPRMSDLNKELAIHNYIVNNTVYDYDNYIKGTLSQESFTDYGVLVQGRAVCEGYAKAMFKLLNMAGVQCIVVKGIGNGESHAWNIVKINGNYTQVDATFDDPVTTSGENILSYNYFDISDSQMAKDHQWNSQKYPKCNTIQYNRN